MNALVDSLSPEPTEHVLAELGLAVGSLESMRCVLKSVAQGFDDDPLDEGRQAQFRALIARQVVHDRATEVLARVAAAGGARLLCHNEVESRRAADLTVYSGPASRRRRRCGARTDHGRVAIMLIVDREHRGPGELAWASSPRLANLPPLGELHARRLVVVTPHPDDEVLGAGGLIQKALAEGILVEIVAVTDGEASHPLSDVAARLDLPALRARETETALRRLGWDTPTITRLHLPDGRVSERRAELDVALDDILLPDDLCVAFPGVSGRSPRSQCLRRVLGEGRGLGGREVIVIPRLDLALG